MYHDHHEAVQHQGDEHTTWTMRTYRVTEGHDRVTRTILNEKITTGNVLNTPRLYLNGSHKDRHQDDMTNTLIQDKYRASLILQAY